MSTATDKAIRVVGLYEWISLPELGVAELRAKIDTGATISSLDATEIQVFERDNQQWVRFTTHSGTLVQQRHCCEARLLRIKNIKSSNGQSQNRYIIRSLLNIGAQSLEVEFSLANRHAMKYRVLIGASALAAAQLLVNSALSYVQPKPSLI